MSRPRQLTFAVGTSLLTMSLGATGCDRASDSDEPERRDEKTVNVRHEPQPPPEGGDDATRVVDAEPDPDPDPTPETPPLEEPERVNPGPEPDPAEVKPAEPKPEAVGTDPEPVPAKDERHVNVRAPTPTPEPTPKPPPKRVNVRPSRD